MIWLHSYPLCRQFELHSYPLPWFCASVHALTHHALSFTLFLPLFRARIACNPLVLALTTRDIATGTLGIRIYIRTSLWLGFLFRLSFSPSPPSLSLFLSLPSGLYGSSRSWFLCMKLRFEPLSWVFAEDTVDRRFDGRWWCSSFAGFLVFYSLVEVDYSFLFRFYRSNRRDFLFSLSILIYSQFIPG